MKDKVDRLRSLSAFDVPGPRTIKKQYGIVVKFCGGPSI